MSKCVAVIDLGTNSLISIIANISKNKISILEENYQIIKLGEGIAENNLISDNAIKRCIQGFGTISKLLIKNNVSTINCIATSALRDALNSLQIINLIKNKFDIKIQVISGIQEANYITIATLNEFDLKSKTSLIFDIGGGSTELIFLKNEKIIHIESINIGSVRSTESFFHATQFKIEDVDKLESYIDTVLNRLPILNINIAIGIAGTITTLSSVKLGLESYSSEIIHKSKLTIDDVQILKTQFIQNWIDKFKGIKGLDPQRSEIILAGCIICEKIMIKYNLKSILVSDKGLRWGVLQGLREIKS
jgi:exopolyphosphatase / guanosine-5'-triphosphate,3'-diphosphate pyrophosphatase